MSPRELIAAALLILGCAFYVAGTVGILRFPDPYCRLHALSKADNLGLLFTCAGASTLSANLRVAALLTLVWLLSLLASTVSTHLIARNARAADPPPGPPP